MLESSPAVQRWKAESLHEAILDVLKHRFTTVPRDVTKQLRAILTEKKLRQLTVLAGECPNLEAFRAALD